VRNLGSLRPILLVAALLMTLTAVPVLSQDKPNDYPGHIAPGEPRTPADEAKAFRLPPGFEMQLVAAEPDIHKPLNMAFDDRGRLWVSDTVEYPFAPKNGKGRDSVKILEDFDENGRARKITTFADGLSIPIGVLPEPGGQSALVYSIPSILHLTDSKGTGQADKRDVLYTKFTTDDTHGMTNSFTWGFDGWVYACHGFYNDSTVKGADGQAIHMQSGNTFRMRPDGSHLEQVTWGQVNPFGLCFDPLGNLFSADCHTQPIYQLLRGAYYPSFGKPHDGLGFGPETITEYKDSTAIAGICYYAADNYPPAYRDACYIGDVVTCRVNQFRLEWHGSSTRATKVDFLRSDDPWFRPVAVILGPDGAMYVADFYNRIIGHYEVPLTHPGRDRERGRIWRIVYRGPDGKIRPQSPRPDWTKAENKELISDLGHPNLTVRTLATNQLVSRGGKDVVEAVRDAMKPGSAPFRRLHGLWVLERVGVLDDRTLADGATDIDRGVRVQAFRILAERKSLTGPQRELTIAGLKDADPFVARCAADTLGRHPAPDNLRALLELRANVPRDDTHLLHVVRMALRDNLRSPAAWDLVARLPKVEVPAVADVSLGVPTPEAAAFLLTTLKDAIPAGEQGTTIVRHIARYGTQPTTDALLALLRGDAKMPPNRQFQVFRAFEQGTQERGGALSEEAKTWAGALALRLLVSKNGEEVVNGITLAGTLRLQKAAPELVALAESDKVAEAQRLAALNSLVAIDSGKYVSLLGRLVANASETITLREQASNILGRLNTAESLDQMVLALPAAPARLQNTLANGLLGGRPGTEKLLDAVEAGKVTPRLLREPSIEPRLSRSTIPGVVERVAKLTKGLPPADLRVQELLNKRRESFVKAKTDVGLGAKVFEKSCAVCHQLGGKGVKIGPQLDGIGIRGLDRILEDVLDPNRNVDQAFRLTTLELTSGQVVSGLLLKEEGAVLVLADAQGKEVRVPTKNVAERRTSHLSPMPANFNETIPEAEFHSLIAYLLTEKVAPTKP
jgi:putative heme-binding domain-containing protein